MKVRRTIAVLILIASLSVSVSAVRTIADVWRRRDAVRVRQAELAEIRRQNDALRATLSDIRTESYLERIARNTLGLVREGESVLIIPDPREASSGARADSRPIWRQWAGLFF